MNIADETLTGYSFLSRYHYTKSKNYLKRRYRIRQWIPMFIGTPCIKLFLKNHKTSQMRKSTKYLNIICFHSPGISTVYLYYMFDHLHFWFLKYSLKGLRWPWNLKNTYPLASRIASRTRARAPGNPSVAGCNLNCTVWPFLTAVSLCICKTDENIKQFCCWLFNWNRCLTWYW